MKGLSRGSAYAVGFTAGAAIMLLPFWFEHLFAFFG